MFGFLREVRSLFRRVSPVDSEATELPVCASSRIDRENSMRFNEFDKSVVNNLLYDPNCEPSFELIRSCLIWFDERTERISNEGYGLLGDLWSVRGYIHQNVSRENWGLDPKYFQTVWDNALNDVPNWPGFKRLELSSRERQYLSESLEAAKNESCY
jgi:hypothetical protein